MSFWTLFWDNLVLGIANSFRFRPIFSIFVLGVLLFAGVSIYIEWGNKSDCEARGGVYVRPAIAVSYKFLCLSPKEI